MGMELSLFSLRQDKARLKRRDWSAAAGNRICLKSSNFMLLPNPTHSAFSRASLLLTTVTLLLLVHYCYLSVYHFYSYYS